MDKKKRRIHIIPISVVAAILAVSLVITAAPSIGIGFIPAWPRIFAAAGLAETPRSDSVRVIDVGQGDSILLQSAGHALLIDAGPAANADREVRYLKSQGVSTIDDLVLTHPHEDHSGGVPAVLRQITVARVIMNQTQPTAAVDAAAFARLNAAIQSQGVAAVAPTVGMQFTIGDFDCKILGPLRHSPVENNNSVVVRAVDGHTSFLLMGDAQQDEENDILGKGETVYSDMIKLGHHGSATSSGEAFLGAVSPKYAVMSVGLHNIYHLPSASVVSLLASLGVRCLRTDVNGTVNFTTDGTAVKESAER